MKESRILIKGIIIGILIAGVMSFYFLNKFYKPQIIFQRAKFTQQAELIDSIRNSGLAILLNGVLDKVDAELTNNPKRILSDETIARITALTYSCKPYIRPEDDSVSTKKLSPERGHLLLVLARMNIDSGSLHKIIRQALFSYADLRGADLKGTDLRGARLQGADLKDANLQDVNLSESDMRSANLWGTDLGHAILTGADLTSADIRWANLNEADLKHSIFNKADLSSAQLRKADLQEASLKWTDASVAFLDEANLSGADMYAIILKRAHLEASNLNQANLSMALLAEANLSDANLTGANLTKVDLSGAVVASDNWLLLLNDWNVTGRKDILNRFKLVTDSTYNPPQYFLKKIEK